MNLSERELQVAQAMCRDLRAPEIAKEMGISHKSVSTYLSRTRRKLGVKTGAALALALRDKGLV